MTPVRTSPTRPFGRTVSGAHDLDEILPNRNVLRIKLTDAGTCYSHVLRALMFCAGMAASCVLWVFVVTASPIDGNSRGDGVAGARSPTLHDAAAVRDTAAVRSPEGTDLPVGESTDPPVDPVSDDARFSLLTILPGDHIYSLWGHSAVRVHDPERGIDSSFNYGTFRFDRYFLPNFLYGRLDYMLSVHYYDAALESYRQEGRPVIEQALKLSPAQKDSLYHFLEVNARPENRVYRYHFLYDNCSTRIRDAFERALGNDVSFASAPDPGATFRDLLDTGTAHRPFLDAGIDWLLGSPVDRIARPNETMFLPEFLMEAFDHATITIDGTATPLVAQTDTVLHIPGYESNRTSSPWATVVMWMVFALGAAVTIRGMQSDGEIVRLLDVPLFAVVGTAGLLIVFLWFISLHDVTENNWHLLWALPTHLVAAGALLRRRAGLWIQRYMLMAAILALTAAAGSPLWGQWFHPALYPLMLLVALRGGWIFLQSRRRPERRRVAAR